MHDACVPTFMQSRLLADRAHGPVRFLRFRPPLILQPYIHDGWILVAAARIGAAAPESFYPFGFSELMLRLGPGRLIVSGRGATAVPRLGLSGIQLTPFAICSDDSLSLVTLRLYPGAAEALGLDERRGGPRPMAPFVTVSRFDTVGLRRRLRVSSDPFQAVASLEGWLARRVEEARHAIPPTAVHETGRLIHAGSGNLRIPAIAAAAGVSPRTLVRRFRYWVGTGPKEVCQVVRFQHAISLFVDGSRMQEVIEACGFFDEPHVHREFRRFAGAGPSAALAAMGPMQRCFHGSGAARSLLFGI